MKYQLWECDRCGKEMRLSPNSKPHQLLVVKDDVTYDLCEDCYSCFTYFMKHPKEFDDLADKICKKEE